jgi:multiple sugar transport system substrate-binding protein
LRARRPDRLPDRTPGRLPSTSRRAPGRRSPSARRLAAAAALALAAAVPVANGAHARPVERITFVAPDYSDKTQSYWQSVIRRFEKRNPAIAVDLQMTHWTDINQKVSTLILTGHTPDILNLDSYANFAGDGSLLPAKDVLSQATRADFVPIFARNGQVHGVQYGIPIAGSVRGLFYNKDIFEQAGIDEPPRTWGQLEQDARRIVNRTGKIGYALPLGPEEPQAEFSLFMWGNGGDWFRDGKWVIDNPRNVAALAFMRRLATEGLTERNPGRTNRATVWQLFEDGRAGMVMGSSFLPGLLYEDAPSLRFGTAPIPSSGGRYRFTLGVEDYLLAFRTTKHRDAVRKFLDFVYSPPIYGEFIKVHGFLPVTRSVSRQVAARDPVQRVFINLASVAKFYPTTNPVWGALQARLKSTLGLALQGPLSPGQVLRSLQRSALRGGR